MLSGSVSNQRYTVQPSPVGDLVLVGDDVGLRQLAFADGRKVPDVTACARDDALFRDAARQLAAYFAGELRAFELALVPKGTAFQQRVWTALQQIPYGTTMSYGQLANVLGDARAVRAVGLANGRNPIAIIIPCHRVIGANGSLTGYGGGLHRKQWLLAREGAALWPPAPAADVAAASPRPRARLATARSNG
jgi:methylated-DNA-[protein]-cysteine S-methyltransferase